ncbi:DUF6207 family protein [Streptomyces sp. B21-101]|uniref:DUF6207 family protein n=1 Tax=Streptomyces sp. B21-101 TaxID=3039415 RepID=UPI002FF41F2F
MTSRCWCARKSSPGVDRRNCLVELPYYAEGGCDDATALAVQELELLATRWATAVAECTTRYAGQPGVRLRCYLDVRQELNP